MIRESARSDQKHCKLKTKKNKTNKQNNNNKKKKTASKQWRGTTDNQEVVKDSCSQTQGWAGTMPCAMWPPSARDRQVTCWQGSRVCIQWQPLHQEWGVFCVPFLLWLQSIAMSSMMMDLGSISGTLGGAALVSKLIPVSFIRKQTLTMGIYMSNSVNQQSLFVSSVQGPKTGVFYPLVCSFASSRQNSQGQ